MDEYTLLHGDCLDAMAAMDAGSVDAVVCDPPYMLHFMGKAFDHPQDNPAANPALWSEALRVCKPGAHLLAFGGDRTHHRMMVAIEDAGWELRTCVYWIFGSGFPKSRNVGKAMRSEMSSDELCACAHRCTETTPDSPGGCPSSLRSDDGLLQTEADTGPAPLPSQRDVRERIHDDLRVDDRGAAGEHSAPGEATVRPSTDCSSPPAVRPSAGSRASDSTPCDMPSSTLRALSTAPHRTASCTQDIPDSASDSASSSCGSSSLSDPNIPHCPVCGKLDPREWDGCGTALKPAAEIIVMARKPLEGTVAANVAKYGTGSLGIEACRIAHDEECRPMKDQPNYGKFYGQGGRHGDTLELKPSGRWPANLVLECTCDETREGTAKTGTAVLHRGTKDGPIYGKGMGAHPVGTPDMTYADANGKEPVRIHTDPNCPCAMLDGQTGTLGGRGNVSPTKSGTGIFHDKHAEQDVRLNDSGGASRFFYCAKASRSERSAGCEGMDAVRANPYGEGREGVGRTGHYQDRQNHHPTVKPLALCRWLVKLVAQPGDVVLDPFMGSGTTGVACAMEGREFIGIEQDAEYLEIARRRIAHASAQGRLPLDESPPLPPVAGRPT